MTKDARQAALYVLNALDKGEQHLDAILAGDPGGTLTAHSTRDRRLINALVYGVVRWRRRLDRIIEQFSNIPVKKIRPQVLNILRIGVFQVFFLDRIPDSAAVNTSVEMAKKIAPPWVAGFVNGVLRNAAREKDSLTPLPFHENPETALSITRSFPQWLVHRWAGRYGIDETENLCDALNVIPPVTVRTNTLKADRDGLLSRLMPEVKNIRKTPYSPDGLCLMRPEKPIEALTAFQAGLFQVQDEAAQLISLLLFPLPGERVLDACAGLGGKTGHLAQLMKNRGRVIAADQDGGKLTRLRVEMNRLGVEIHEVITCDIENIEDISLLGRFDRILLDAPCSGLGVIRRNPDIKWDESRADLNRFADKQLRLLANAAGLLKPGGTLVYAVCSLEPEENEGVIFGFLKNRPHFKIIRNFDALPFDVAPFTDQNGFFRSLPHIHNTDGFFAACLKRLK